MSRGHFKCQPVLVPCLFFRLVLCWEGGRGGSGKRVGRLGIREKLTFKANHSS
jgi:hypothetical protein